MINFVDRQLITSLQIPLRDDPKLGLTDVRIQLLAGYAFSIVYSCAGLMLGSLADRWHRPRLVALGLLVWSAMTAASGLAQNFWQMGLARIFVAVGEATLTPAAVAMIGDLFRPRQRSLASGLYYLGIPLGASFSLIVANLLWPIPWIGWRGCFLLLGLIGLSMVVVLMLHQGPTPRGDGRCTGVPFRAARRTASRRRAARGDLPDPAPIAGPGPDDARCHPHQYFGRHHLARLLLAVRRAGLLEAGRPDLPGRVPCSFGGSLGNVLGGWLGDRLNRRW